MPDKEQFLADMRYQAVMGDKNAIAVLDAYHKAMEALKRINRDAG